jgi:hypothetical protein
MVKNQLKIGGIKMKKSEITVSMPMTAFEELEQYKKKYQELQDELNSCFDTKLVDSLGGVNTIDFSIKKVLEICKKTLSVKYNRYNINCIS